jgi:SAM-dependent methyltransferase
MDFLYATSLVLLSCMLLLTLAVSVFGLFNLVALFVGAPFVPTPMKKVHTMVHLARLEQTDIVMDVGSGDGRLVLLAAPLCARAIGIELNPLLVWISKIRAKKKGSSNATMTRSNFWNTDLSDLTVLFVYCLDTHMDALKEKIVSEMKPGSRIVSHGFTFPQWTPTEVKGNIYLYQL